MSLSDNLSDPLRQMHDRCYQHGQCQALLYDGQRTDIFPGPSYLAQLYERCRLSGQRSHGKLGILPALFCGMRDLGCEAVVSYLHQLPVVVVGEWRKEFECPTCAVCGAHLWKVDLDNKGAFCWSHYGTPADGHVAELAVPDQPLFHALGFCFPTAPPTLVRADRQPANRNSLFAGYCFFEEAWRTPQQEVLMWLGLSYLFHEFRLAAIHGVRYADNFLTARWCRRFGFRDLGMIPNYLYRAGTGDLAAAVVSSLDRGVFEDRLRTVLADLEETG